MLRRKPCSQAKIRLRAQVMVTPTVEVNDGPQTSHSTDTANLATPASNVVGNKNRKQKRCAECKEQTAAQQEKHCVKPGGNLSCKKKRITKIL